MKAGDRNWRWKYVILVVLFICGCSSLNSYQKQGDLQLAGLSSSVTVVRDEKGMAYDLAFQFASVSFGPDEASF